MERVLGTDSKDFVLKRLMWQPAIGIVLHLWWERSPRRQKGEKKRPKGRDKMRGKKKEGEPTSEKKKGRETTLG